MSRLVVPLRVRSTEHAGRKVTWLELFFDLIFVAAVAQVAQPLRHDYSLTELARFTPLFVLIWWAWTGHTLFSTRFDTDDGVQRAMTFVQIFAVAAMAANAKDALGSRSSAGFAAAYAVGRLVLVGQYVRARTVTDARGLTIRYIIGHGSAAGLWLVSALVPPPARFWLWALACAIDLGTPWLAVRHSVDIPPDAAHLPERFGLFTLILLGESVVAVMQGMESQEDWTPAAALSAFLGMAVPFLISWWYFDGAGGAGEQRVRTRRDAIRFHIWCYAHLPMYFGIIVTGVGIYRIVTAASRYTLTSPEIAILTIAAGTVTLALTIVGATSSARSRLRVPDGGPGSALSRMWSRRLVNQEVVGMTTTHDSNRRRFLARLFGTTAGLTVFAAGRADAQPAAAAASGPDAWIKEVKGTHRCLFDFPQHKGGTPLLHILNYLNTYNEAYKSAPGSVGAVGTFYSIGNQSSIALGFNDAMWAKYGLGDYLGLKDKAGKGYTRNVFHKMTGDDAHILIQAFQTPNIPELVGAVPAIGIENLQKMGTKFLLCANALGAWCLELQARGKGKSDEIEKDLRANLLPGVTIVPAMVIAIEKAQAAGIRYNRQ